jgi:hypothetical protein
MQASIKVAVGDSIDCSEIVLLTTFQLSLLFLLNANFTATRDSDWFKEQLQVALSESSQRTLLSTCHETEVAIITSNKILISINSWVRETFYIFLSNSLSHQLECCLMNYLPVLMLFTRLHLLTSKQSRCEGLENPHPDYIKINS